LGDELLRSAERSRSHIAWKSPDAPDQAALTGMSHGATGAALALAELFGECGERRFEEGAGLALAFESQCFWAEAGNWQDFRGITQEVAFEAPRQFATSWCHGAPGIALARLRIHEIIGGDALLADARTGLATTGRHVQACIGQPGSHMGLCHGLSGNAEILLEGARTLVPEAQDRSVAEDAAAAIVQSLQSGELLNRLDGPGMMVGTAGVGLFLIRLIDPKVPSVLLVK
jgi:lantibiotic modifying enzyme